MRTETFLAYTLRVIWDLLSFLSFPCHFSKLGLSSEGGIRDFRAWVTTADPDLGVSPSCCACPAGQHYWGW